MNIDFLEQCFLQQCYGTQVFCALEMLSVIVTSATLKFSSVHLVFIIFVSEKKRNGGCHICNQTCLGKIRGIKHGSLNSTCLL